MRRQRRRRRERGRARQHVEPAERVVRAGGGEEFRGRHGALADHRPRVRLLGDDPAVAHAGDRLEVRHHRAPGEQLGEPGRSRAGEHALGGYREREGVPERHGEEVRALRRRQGGEDSASRSCQREPSSVSWPAIASVRTRTWALSGKSRRRAAPRRSARRSGRRRRHREARPPQSTGDRRDTADPRATPFGRAGWAPNVRLGPASRAAPDPRGAKRRGYSFSRAGSAPNGPPRGVPGAGAGATSAGSSGPAGGTAGVSGRTGPPAAGTA
jgi:hypothetical protein